MGLLDSIFNSASAIAQTHLNYKYSKKLQQHQYDLNRQALREYYLNNRYSLERGGYNPLLGVPGSTAQGFSASANMSTPPAQSDGMITDDVNAVTSARTAIQNLKNLKQENKKLEASTKSLELDNKKKELDLKTNPKNVVVNSLEGKELPGYIKHGIKFAKDKFGIDLTPPSAKSNNSDVRPVVILHDDKPYVQKGVPKSVVKSFYSPNSAYSALDKLPRKPEIGTIRFKGYRKTKFYNNKPPKTFPSGM